MLHASIIHNMNFIHSLILIHFHRHRKFWEVHAKTDHFNVIDWICGRCQNQFPDLNTLFSHAAMWHQEGLFECTMDGCDFTARKRPYVLKHFKKAHHSNVYRDHDDNHDDRNSVASHSSSSKAIQVKQERYEPALSFEYRRISSVSSTFIVIGQKCHLANCNVMLPNFMVYKMHLKKSHGMKSYFCLVEKCGESYKTM